MKQIQKKMEKIKIIINNKKYLKNPKIQKRKHPKVRIKIKILEKKKNIWKENLKK